MCDGPIRVRTEPTSAFDNAVGPDVRRGQRAQPRLWGGLFGLLIVAAAQTSTQLCASDFAYQRVLGPNTHHLYPPWAVGVWAVRWGEQYPAAFHGAGNAGLLVLCGGTLLLWAAKLGLTRPNPYIHGSARWANQQDLRQSGLLASGREQSTAADAVYVGSWLDRRGRQHYLRHSGPEHVLCYAPTRSGKGVGLVVPTLLSWGPSAFVSDLKGELWSLTAGWRSRGARNRVLRFEPAAREGSVRWNPLDEIRVGSEHEVADVQNLATLIVDPDGKGLETHWQKTAQALLVGVILHVVHKARAEGTPATLSEVDRVLADPSRPIAALWNEMTATAAENDACHSAVAAAGRDMLDRPEEEAGSVLSTAKSYLALYRDPVVAQNTSGSDFHVRDLMHGDVPMTLYLVTQPVDKDRLRPLVRTLVNMTLRLLADRLEFENGQPKPLYQHRLLLMLDELVAMKRLAILQESLAFIAGYGIKAYLICQDIGQLRSADGYGRDETLTSNCHVQVAFPPNRLETAEHLSRLTGQTTVPQEQVTFNGGAASLFSNRSRTMQWVQRALLTPDECLRLPSPQKDARGHIVEPGDMLVFVAGYPAIYGKQPLYFQDEVFRARAALAAPEVCS
jgi:type IV secretion system protein VirD4